MSAGDEMPKGMSQNTPDQSAILESAISGAILSAGPHVTAVAVIIAFDDGGITAGVGGMHQSVATGFARIDIHGPDILRMTMERMKEGKGKTRVIPVQEPGEA